MRTKIEQGFVAFIGDGPERIGGIVQVAGDDIVVHVENGGPFVVPMSAVHNVHDQKVILDPKRLDPALLDAVGHQTDGEDPQVAG